jgi:hypothetical protein
MFGHGILGSCLIGNRVQRRILMHKVIPAIEYYGIIFRVVDLPEITIEKGYKHNEKRVEF